MKRNGFLISILALSVLFITGCCKPPCYDCGAGKRGFFKGHYHKDKSVCSYEDCLLNAPCFVVKKKDELGLSDDQVNKVKDLCTVTKKEHIQLEADIEKIFVDIKTKMHEVTLDVGGINALIDKKYELKKQKSKALISSFARLNNDILTEEQREKFKEFRDKCKEGKCGKGCSSCPCKKEEKE